MSTNAMAGALALAATLFVPGYGGSQLDLRGSMTPAELSTSAFPLPPVDLVHGLQLKSAKALGEFDNRDYQANLRRFMGTAGEDHPFVSQEGRGNPHLTLNVAQGQTGPHDDF